MNETNVEAKVGQEVICKQCGETFVYTERDFEILNKGLELPKRCTKCRAKNRFNRKVDERIDIKIKHITEEVTKVVRQLAQQQQ
jgi:DNA replicative helicase MCM subunit Mcm2 (Cdc46/Mcm family)